MIYEVGRYGLKGGAFVLVNVAVQILLVEFGSLHPAVAAAISTALLPLAGYVVMNRFVFPDADTSSGRGVRRFGGYYAVIMSSKVLNYGLFIAFLAVGVWYPVAYLLGAILVFVGTFSANRWLWHGRVAG